MCYNGGMKRRERKDRSAYTIKAVVRTLKVLEEFVKSEEKEIELSELTRRVNLQKNNVFRILATLEMFGYIEQNMETESYKLGPRCLLLGDAYLRELDPVGEKRRALREISAGAGESTYLCVKNGGAVYHILSSHPSDEVIRVDVKRWIPFPADKHVAGKVIEEAKKQLLADGGGNFTPVVDAISMKDVISIGFPVVDEEGIHAIVVYIPAYRGSEERIQFISNIGMKIVNELNRRLGGKRF